MYDPPLHVNANDRISNANVCVLHDQSHVRDVRDHWICVRSLASSLSSDWNRVSLSVTGIESF